MKFVQKLVVILSFVSGPIFAQNMPNSLLIQTNVSLFTNANGGLQAITGQVIQYTNVIVAIGGSYPGGNGPFMLASTVPAATNYTLYTNLSGFQLVTGWALSNSPNNYLAPCDVYDPTFSFVVYWATAVTNQWQPAVGGYNAPQVNYLTYVNATNNGGSSTGFTNFIPSTNGIGLNPTMYTVTASPAENDVIPIAFVGASHPIGQVINGYVWDGTFSNLLWTLGSEVNGGVVPNTLETNGCLQFVGGYQTNYAGGTAAIDVGGLDFVDQHNPNGDKRVAVIRGRVPTSTIGQGGQIDLITFTGLGAVHAGITVFSNGAVCVGNNQGGQFNLPPPTGNFIEMSGGNVAIDNNMNSYAISTTATNALAVSTAGVTNNTTTNYLLSITAGTAMSMSNNVNSGTGFQMFTPVIGGTYPLKPGWVFHGTAVTALAIPY